ncbi:hypothetical protein Bhyg_08465 [Pseudolycoriella hygida]|uniref:Uncharacterized protein n=1 Tax=Pseudolycoriella hygida TaxID=35572 RepID=A0A9Q0N4P2_9DIPT|nr:hypothetical protein Bhyg_08465 [Pseudolycoriella hygida]
MDNYDEMASAVGRILLESKIGRCRRKRKNHDKKRAEIQPSNVNSNGRGGRIFKRNTAAIENQRFFRENGANNANVSGARQENDDRQKKAIREFLQRYKKSIKKRENETEMEKAIREMVVFLAVSGKRDENESEIDVATRKMREFLTEYHRKSSDRDMLQKGKSVGKCIGDFNKLESKFFSEPNCDIDNLLTKLEKQNFEYVEAKIEKIESTMRSLQKKMVVLDFKNKKPKETYLYVASKKTSIK